MRFFNRIPGVARVMCVSASLVALVVASGAGAKFFAISPSFWPF
jgi:hypothetical protein